MLPTEKNNRQMEPIPIAVRKKALEIPFGAFHRISIREPPARREAVNMGIDRKRRDAESLGHDDARGLVSDPGQGLESIGVATNVARGGAGVVFGEDVTASFLRRCGRKQLVRSHQCVEEEHEVALTVSGVITVRDIAAVLSAVAGGVVAGGLARRVVQPGT